MLRALQLADFSSRPCLQALVQKLSKVWKQRIVWNQLKHFNREDNETNFVIAELVHALEDYSKLEGATTQTELNTFLRSFSAAILEKV